MPIAIRTDAIRKWLRIILFAPLSIIAISCSAGESVPSIQICHLLTNPDRYNGKLVKLNTEVRITLHGRYIFGSKCSNLGTLGLKISDKTFKDKSTIKFIRQILADGGGTKSVVMIGYLDKTPTNNLTGVFVLKQAGYVINAIKEGDAK